MKIKNTTSIYTNDKHSCAITVFSNAFRVDESNIFRVFKQLGRKRHEGCTKNQINKAIEIVSAIKGKFVLYKSEKNNPSLNTLSKRLKKGKYIVNCAGHVSYLKDGVYYDDYLYYATRYPILYDPLNRENLKVLGYWKILDKEPIYYSKDGGATYQASVRI